MTNHVSQWADLPKELLEMIGTRLDSRVDVLRFRAVCTSWRSTVPAPCFDQEIPPLVLNLPLPIKADVVLMQTTVCRMEVLHQPESTSNSSSPSKGWLTKVGQSRRGKLLLLHPVTNQEIKYPLQLNLLDLRFVHFSTTFTLKWSGDLHVFGVIKVVLFPVSATCGKTDQFGILAIFHEGKLGYWKYGDEKWTLLDDKNFQYDDIIVYKGQAYVVERWGTVSWVDSSLRLIQYSPPLYGCGAKKNLVESCGALHVVDRYLDAERMTWKDYENIAGGSDIFRVPIYRKYNPAAIDFRVYKLDEEWGTWVDVKSLDDRLFVLGVDCSFSISSREFYGGKGNCICFIDDELYIKRGFRGADVVRVFQLEDHRIEKLAAFPEYYDIFLPDIRSL